MPSRRRQRSLRPVEPGDRSGLAASYTDSWAVVIGIDRYEHLNGLSLATRDALGMAELLVRKLGFPREHVFVVIDPPPDPMPAGIRLQARHATKAVIEDLLFNQLPSVTKVDDRVLIFYAGHGERCPVAQAKLDNVGYLVPSDAQPGQWHTFIEWDAVMRAGDYCRAKHIFYLLDACYSGIAAARAAVKAARYTEDMLKARVRQVLTAGTAKQTVADAGPHGHSLVTSYVLEGLGGAAAMFDKGTITASELMVYVRNRVAPRADSKQTPAFSMLDTEPGGDFVFALPPQKKPASDLSRWFRILDQGPLSHAVVAAMEACLRRQGTPARLSPQKLVELGRVLDSFGPDGGESMMTIVNAAQAFGVPVEKVERGGIRARANVGKARLSDSVPRATCNARCTSVENVDQIPDHLSQGRPVVLGLAWYPSFDHPTARALPMPGKGEEFVGGHAVTIVGYDPEADAFRFANSWGRNWGDRGFGAIGRKTLEGCSSDMWAIDATLFVWGT